MGYRDPGELGLTRREALRRGLLVGGLVWTVPTIQVVKMARAFAQVASPVPGPGPGEGGGNGGNGGGNGGNGGVGPGVLPKVVTPEAGGPPVGGEQAAAGPGVAVGPSLVGQAGPGGQPLEVLPKTGLEVGAIGALGGALTGAGIVTLKAADLLSRAQNRGPNDLEAEAEQPE